MNQRGKPVSGMIRSSFPEDKKITFAEMTGEEKDSLSHRGKALEKLAEFLHSHPPFINKTNIEIIIINLKINSF